MLQAHGFSLDSIFKDVEEYASDIRAQPVDRIPRAPHSVSGDSVSSKVSILQESEDGEHDMEDELGRGERRKMYLLGLRNIVPELKHAPLDQGQTSGHFSLLQTKDKGDKMPFLANCFNRCLSLVSRNRVKNVIWLKRLLICIQLLNQQRVDYCNHGLSQKN